jgi:hypothetical protein
MEKLPLIVKRRDPYEASITTVHCDTVQDAIEVMDYFRGDGYVHVWIEDVDGRKVSESELEIQRI